MLLRCSVVSASSITILLLHEHIYIHGYGYESVKKMRLEAFMMILCLLGTREGKARSSYPHWRQLGHRYNTLPGKLSKHSTMLEGLLQELKMALTFSSDQVDKDLDIVAPPNKAEIIYDGGVKVEMGNVLTPTQVQNQPTVSWPVEEGALYTVLLTDPDAPSRQDPKWAEWRHWLVVNIPGTNVAEGEVEAEYIGAGPPKGTGLHRYILLVFKQSGRITYSDPKLGLSTKDRNNTKTKDLMTKYNLGNPVAGNFFKAEWDDYVPKLYEKLNG